MGLEAMPHPSRLAALQAIQQRKPMACETTPSLEEIWASDVFTLARMKNALPKEAFKVVRRVIREGVEDVRIIVSTIADGSIPHRLSNRVSYF